MNLIIALFLYISSGIYSYGLRDTSEYEAYLTKYNKTYNKVLDFWEHFKIFNENMGKIIEHNYEDHTWKMGINNFTDMSHDEYKKNYLYGTNNNTLYTSPILNQHCYAGLRPNLVEHCSYCLLFRKLASNLTCTNIYNLTGCKDGMPMVSIDQLGFTNDGRLLSAESDINCTGRLGCGGKGIRHPDTPEWNPRSGYRGLNIEEITPHYSEEVNCTKKLDCGTDNCSIQFLNAVSTISHVSVTIDADFGMQHYHSGIYSNIRCSTKKLYHDVLVVGYGVTAENKTYYIIKNTWGTNWGVDGYMYWDRDIPDLCN